MKVERIKLKNWMRFRGEHELVLGPGVHSVVARHEQDAGRSNWLGKSSLLGTIPFALYGRHVARTEDDWITDGEKDGFVELELSGGDVVRRERKLGKSTQLSVLDRNGTVRANGDAAQALVVQLVGMGERDFYATCFFEQKQMARLVLARPAERMEIVSAWLDLEPLQRCEERVRLLLSDLTAQDAALANRLSVVRNTRAATAARFGVEQEKDPAGALRKKAAKAAKVRDKAQAELDAAEAAREAVRERQVAWPKVAQYDELVSQGKALAAELKAVDADNVRALDQQAREQYAAQVVELAKIDDKLSAASELVRGAFDGACPVLAGFACPAAATINGKRAEATKQLRELTASRAAWQAEASASHALTVKGMNMLQALAAKQVKLEALREQVRALKPQADAARAVGEPPDELPSVDHQRAELNALEVGLREAERAAEDLEQWAMEEAQVQADRDKLADTIALHRAAMLIFGRNGAQRRVAEAALRSIEAGANALLDAAGIDLEIAVSWAREGQGLATHCDACGSPYPASQRVKQCERCGAQRGPKQIDRLDVELSDRSGAAEDLAGIAFQLAAGAWLRQARGAAWSVACIDEPFGALDETLKRSLATHIATMLMGRYGFEQALVVSHDSATREMMPHVIEIVAGDAGSRFA